MSGHIHSIKSNARRQARKDGLDPETCVHAKGDGWVVRAPAPAKSLKKKKPAAKKGEFNPRKFDTYKMAEKAMAYAAKQSGLKLILINYVGGFAFVPAHMADDFEPATKPASNPFEGPIGRLVRADYRPKPAKTPKPKRVKGAGTDHQATVLAMLTSKGGAAMPDIQAATGWLAHTARARISGIVKANKLAIERNGTGSAAIYRAFKQDELPLADGKAA